MTPRPGNACHCRDHSQDSDCVKKTPLPDTWPATVKSAVLHVISLAQFAAAHTRGWAADSVNARVRLKAENDRLEAEIRLLREEIRIKDARMTRSIRTSAPVPAARTHGDSGVEDGPMLVAGAGGQTFLLLRLPSPRGSNGLTSGPRALMQLPGNRR